MSRIAYVCHCAPFIVAKEVCAAVSIGRYICDRTMHGRRRLLVLGWSRQANTEYDYHTGQADLPKNQQSQYSSIAAQSKVFHSVSPKWHRRICTRIYFIHIYDWVHRSRLRNRNCRQNDQRTFTSNLLNVFHNEYKRAHPTEETIGDEAILDWKFNQLDANKDEKIHKTELKRMLQVIRQVNIYIEKRMSASVKILVDFQHGNNVTYGLTKYRSWNRSDVHVYLVDCRTVISTLMASCHTKIGWIVWIKIEL